MKTIGLIGGMSWESTAHYYELLNRLTNQRLGGYASAKLLLYSVNFAELHELQFSNRWDEATELMLDAARKLEHGGADCVVITANTMHISAPAIEENVALPLLHIADAAGARLVANNVKKVGLLGTSFTMEKEFYRERLKEKFGLDVIVPDAQGRKATHDIIFNELVRSEVKPESKQRFREIIAALIEAGAEAVLLGCTELMMIIDQGDSAVPVFDTTAIHCEAAVEWALAE